MTSQIGYDIEFEEISTTENTLNWCLMPRFMLDMFYKKPNFRKTVVIAITLLLGTSVLSGCTGDEDTEHSMVGIWYEDDEMNGAQFTAAGVMISITEGLPDGEEGVDIAWSTDGDRFTINVEMSFLVDDFVCDNGEEIPGDWVNDGMEDCADGSDEGVDTSGMEMDTITYTMVYKYEIVGDVLFLGTLSVVSVMDGVESSSTIPEEGICDSSGSDCMSFIRASALGNVLYDTVLNGVDAPDWWVAPPEDDWD